MYIATNKQRVYQHRNSLAAALTELAPIKTRISRLNIPVFSIVVVGCIVISERNTSVGHMKAGSSSIVTRL